MEEHAIASLKANRNLLRKRSFRNNNLVKGSSINKSKNKVVLSKEEKRALAEKWAKRDAKKYRKELFGYLLFWVIGLGVAIYFTVRLMC